MFADSYINYAFSTIFVPFALFLLLFRYFFVQSVHRFSVFYSISFILFIHSAKIAIFFVYLPLFFVSSIQQNPCLCKKDLVREHIFHRAEHFLIQIEKNLDLLSSFTDNHRIVRDFIIIRSIVILRQTLCSSLNAVFRHLFMQFGATTSS